MHGFGNDPDEFLHRVNDPLWRITHDHLDKLDPLGGSLFEEIDGEDDEDDETDRGDSDDDDEDEDIS